MPQAFTQSNVAKALTSPILGGTGSSAKRTVAYLEGLFLMVDGRFPMVRYIGQAFLSPEKFVRWVLAKNSFTEGFSIVIEE